LRVTGGESKEESREESRVEGPESRAEASGVLPSSFALRGSGVTVVTGGVSDHSKSNIPNTSLPNAWPVEFLDIDCNRKKTV